MFLSHKPFFVAKEFGRKDLGLVLPVLAALVVGLCATDGRARSYPDCTIFTGGHLYLGNPHVIYRAPGQWTYAAVDTLPVAGVAAGTPTPRFDLYAGIIAPDGGVRFWVGSKRTGVDVALLPEVGPLGVNIDQAALTGITSSDLFPVPPETIVPQWGPRLRLDVERPTPLGLHQLFCVVVPAGQPLNAQNPSRWGNSAVRWLLVVEQ